MILERTDKFHPLYYSALHLRFPIIFCTLPNQIKQMEVMTKAQIEMNFTTSKRRLVPALANYVHSHADHVYKNGEAATRLFREAESLRGPFARS